MASKNKKKTQNLKNRIRKVIIKKFFNFFIFNFLKELRIVRIALFIKSVDIFNRDTIWLIFEGRVN